MKNACRKLWDSEDKKEMRKLGRGGRAVLRNNFIEKWLLLGLNLVRRVDTDHDPWAGQARQSEGRAGARAGRGR